MLFFRQFIGITNDAFSTFSGENAVLNDHFARLSLVEPGALSGVFALGIFPNKSHIDVFNLHVLERAVSALEEPDRTEVDVLIKVVPNPDQQVA